jgi:hypothetical protein
MRLYYYVVVFLIVLSGRKSMAQDLIVTNVGDSISCRIRQETFTEVHFSYLRYNQHISRKMGKDRISSIVRGFYVSKDPRNPARNSAAASVHTTPKDITASKAEDLISTESSEWIRWQTGIRVGYTRRLFRSRISATDYERLYDQKLKPGISAGADAFYFPWKSVGFGLHYDLYINSAERDVRTRDQISIQFLGLGIAHRKIFANQTTSVLSSFLVGYQPYRNKARYMGQDYKLRGNTMGWAVSVGIDQRISKNLAIGLSGNCMLGSVFKFNKTYEGSAEVVNLSHHEQEDLSRASVILSLKFVK